MDLPPRIGRFTLVDEVGKSPTSIVAKAHDESLDSPAIVKLISLGDERFATRCMRGLERWQQLGIGGIQKLVDIGKAHGQAWYAADPVMGGTLQAELEERKSTGQRWTDKQVFQIGRKIAATLDLLHGLQIVHGNLKPSNVLGRSDIDLTLTDLGLARASEASEIPSWIGGISAYRHLSPDQLLGMKPLDARSDIYQLGLILYECATSIHPFEKVESAQGLLDRSALPIDPPEKVVKGFDSKLSKAIMLCLARERDKRHPSIKDFSRAWSSVTAKYESLTDVPVAAMNPDAGAPRKTARFSGQQRTSGRMHVSQQLDASIREIKPTPRWVQLAGVGALALGVAAAGWFVYARQTQARIEGEVEREPVFAGVRLSWRTSLPCETTVHVTTDGGPARVYKNAQEPSTQKHSVVIPGLAPGKAHRVAVQLGDRPSTETWEIAAPAARPFSRVRIAPKGEDALELAFTTAVKAKTTARARVGGHETDLPISTDHDTAHDGAFEKAWPARLANLSLEAADREGTKVTLSAAQLADQVTAPLLKAVTSGPLAEASVADAAETITKLDLSSTLSELAAVDGWCVESPDLSDERRRALYKALNGLERALARSARPVSEDFAALKPFLDSPHLRGQVITTGELVRACEGVGKTPAASPVALLVQLGLFTHLKPGLFTSPAAKTRVAFDPKPQFAEVVGKNVAVVRLPAPPAGEYRSAQLAVAVTALPRDGMLVATPRGEPGEMMLYSPVARPAPPPGEQWVALRLPPRAFAEGGSVEISISLEPVGGSVPNALKVLGALIVYR